MYATLQDMTREGDLVALNAHTMPITALLHMPDTNMVKVVFGCGFGASNPGTTAPTDGRILCLTGEGGADMGPPTPLVLPATAAQQRTVRNPHIDAVLQAFEPEQQWPLFRQNNLPPNVEEEVLQLAPIPAYFVMMDWNKTLELKWYLSEFWQQQH